jgi:hypothetical protein
LENLFKSDFTLACPFTKDTKLHLYDYSDYEVKATSITKNKQYETFSLDKHFFAAFKPKDAKSYAPLISATRYFTGFGQQDGGLKLVLYNRHKSNVSALISQMFPWYMHLYMHTMTISLEDLQDWTLPARSKS